jgi:hypothetical protein
LSRPPLIESRIRWPRRRLWRPGEPITLSKDGVSVTYRLRSVMRDGDPDSEYATVLLEPMPTGAANPDDAGSPGD